MRVIHLVRSTSWGGGERYALDLCRYAAGQGHDVTAITRGVNTVDRNFREASVPLLRMPLGGVLDFVTPLRLARLVSRMPEERVVIHVHNFKDAELVARTKLLLGKSGGKIWLVCTRHLVKAGKCSRRWRGIYDAIDRLVFVSALTRREFLSTAPPVDESRVRTVLNSIIVPEKYAVPRPLPGRQEVRLLFTGRLSPEKGVDVLIRAMAMLGDMPLRLSVAGTGNPGYVNELKRLARECGVEARIEWKGFLNDVFAEIVKADICVAPSVWREPFGLMLLEYMSQGRPAVTSSSGAQPEIMTDGIEGILVKSGDHAALAGAIGKLAEDAELRRRMGEEAYRTYSEKFAYEKFFDRIIDIYGE
ncbi:MAG: glycosyltransferase family 4 protein [Muribaculaceae bacterium]|nr:glycosyltransferase family 4 protein [Muribaculaceae bacterium]